MSLQLKRRVFFGNRSTFISTHLKQKVNSDIVNVQLEYMYFCLTGFVLMLWNHMNPENVCCSNEVNYDVIKLKTFVGDFPYLLGYLHLYYPLKRTYFQRMLMILGTPQVQGDIIARRFNLSAFWNMHSFSLLQHRSRWMTKSSVQQSDGGKTCQTTLQMKPRK